MINQQFDNHFITNKENGIVRVIDTFIAPKFAISQSDAMYTVLIMILRYQRYISDTCDMYGRIMAEFGYSKYKIVSFWYPLQAYQAHVYSNVTVSHQNTNHGSMKLA